MKRTSLLLFAAALTLSAAAQSTFTVADGPVLWHYDANALDEVHMPFSDGNTLTVNGRDYTLSPSLSMSVGHADYAPLTVSVNYLPSGVEVSAPGALADRLTITAAGQNVDITAAASLNQEVVYVLSGSGESFALHGDYKSTVVLDGVSLRATGEQPALWIDNGKRIEIKANDGTVNTFADAAGNKKKAAFYVKGHTEWKGDGSVSIAGATRHAYASGEYTLFKNSFTGNFNVTSAGSDGMHVEQYLEIRSGNFNIAGNRGDGIDVAYTYEDDGLTPTTDEHNGQFIMSGGTITVSAKADGTKGLKCDDLMTIAAGRITATADGDGSRGVSAGTDLILGTEGATDATASYIYLTANGDEYTDPATGDTDKCRGLKVKRDFYHYPSTLERNAESLVTKKKIVDVDGSYKALGGTLVGITIQ